MQVDRILEALDRDLRAARAGEMPGIVALSGRFSSGSEGEPVIRIEVVLDDPPAASFGWDPRALFDIRQAIRTLLFSQDDDLPPAVIEFVPVTPDPDDGD